jgi:peptide/nickel transport system substrate-binding protein
MVVRSTSSGAGVTGRRSRFRAVAVIAAAAFAASSLAACGGSSDGGNNAGGDVTFTYALTGVPSSLDPADYEGDPSRDIGYEMGSTLFRWNSEKLPSFGCDALPTVSDITGELAKSWKRSADGKTITVTLNDAKSSFGNNLTANDVKWTFDRLIALEVGTPDTLMHTITHSAADPISVVDDHTFEIHLDSASNLDLAILTWPQFRILDSTEVKKHASSSDEWGKEFLKTTSANFGPWQNSSSDFDSGNKLTMHANPNYTADRGDVRTLVMLSVPDASSRAQLLQTGNADYAAALQYDQYAELKNAKNVDVQTCASADRIPLVLNEKDPKLAKQDVRKAISMAIDRDAIVKAVYHGFNQPSKYGLSQSYDYPTTDAGTYKFDVAQAKQLMQKAGVDSIDLTLIESPARPGPEAEQIAILLKNQLSKIGVNVKIQPKASATDLNTVFHEGTYQAVLYLEPPAISDPYYSLSLYNTSTSSLNTFHYKNERFDSLTNTIATTEPGDQRNKAISEAAEIVVQDPPCIYLVDKQFVHAVSTEFGNYQHPPNGEVFVYTLTKK